MKKMSAEELKRMKRFMDKNPDVERDARRSAESGDPKAYYLLGKALYYSEKYEEAEKYFKAAEEGGYIPLLMELRKEQLEKGCFQKAEEYLRKAADKGDCSAQLELGKEQLEKGCFPQAEKYLSRAADQGDCSAKLHLSYLLFETGRKAEAERYIDEVCEELPSKLGERIKEFYTDVKTRIGICLAHKGIKNEKAFGYLRTAADEGNVYVQEDLGMILLRSEDSAAEGEKYLRKAADSGVTAAQEKLASYYQRTGRVSEAESYYRTAAEGGSVCAEFALGSLLINMERYDEAETVFRSLLDTNASNSEPDSEDDHYLGRAAYCLSHLLADTGRAEEGEKYLRKAAGFDIGDAMRELIALLRERGEHEEAEWWEKVLYP